MNSQYAILACGVGKRIGHIEAIRALDLQVERGEMFCITGSVGAGKSILLELLTGIRKADSGDIRIFGMDVRTHLNQIKQRVGIQLQASSLYDRMTVKEALHLFQSYYHKKRSLDELIEMLSLESYMNQYIYQLSAGMRHRVSLAVSVVHDPELIVLDEPYANQESKYRKEMWTILSNLRDEGKTVVIATCAKEEAQQHCDRVASLIEGAIMVHNTNEPPQTAPPFMAVREEKYRSLKVFKQKEASA
ncbi:ABC transporter ATP-binding protein [Paenibacillus xylaniclasticus]|uniref:ABC transporter ATP-binding protein n=1 Tax=Paenibacillus xylaniclasticus TaxID=588083 RepID=UPI000FDC6C60|nr:MULTISPECIES: ABC transporter ATP-binding protein [Paenibacillus]GFN33112.1 ABC transporter ATP-binding protein [Paenibacillus curdlanolyticus]